MHALKRRLAIHRRLLAFQEWPSTSAALATGSRTFLSRLSQEEIMPSKDLPLHDMPSLQWPIRSLQKLRSKVELLRSQILALKAEEAACPLERQRLWAESNLAFLRSSQIAGLPVTWPNPERGFGRAMLAEGA